MLAVSVASSVVVAADLTAAAALRPRPPIRIMGGAGSMDVATEEVVDDMWLEVHSGLDEVL